MKVILLAGGFGTRLSEYTDSIPKPMVQIGDKPMLWHIMSIYAKYNYKDFVIAAGYKSEVIKEYFSKNAKDWNVELVETGKNTMTGGRVKRLQKIIGNETCMLTYGDGLSNINLDSLIEFHKSHKKLVTVSAVRPPARFGAIELNENKVTSFKEKSHLGEGWINGGFFVVEPEFFNFIHGDSTYLEREPLEKAVSKGELFAYKHNGFWQCMDTKRDKDNLEEIYSKDAPWLR
jgi:glucose-1-phosphate cytidylyltransferase|tara:strand:+ start:893 stop:1588 length:696 start_codon:yes stop_codon:yes gene_type:complete